MLKLIILFRFFFHPFHVSVCEINFEPNEKKLEITQKIFLDDLELALSGHFEQEYEIDKLIEENKLQGLLETYIAEKFSLTADGKSVEIQFLGIEPDIESVWCYLQGNLSKKKLRNLTVKSEILTETFDDQINLVHLTANGQIQSEKLGTEEILGEFVIEE